MTNSKHLVKCPFYEYEKENFVKCEDVKRTFKWIKQKDDYMYRFCDDEWTMCIFAQRMQQAYEEGRDMEEIKIESLKSENRKLERRLKQSESRNAAKDDEIKKLRKKCKTLGDKYIKIEASQRKAAEEIISLAAMYEERFAYLMAEYADGVLDEKEMEDWSKDKEFSIFADKVEDGRVVLWKVIVRLQDDKNDNTTESKDEEKQSEDHNEPEDRQTDDRPEQ